MRASGGPRWARAQSGAQKALRATAVHLLWLRCHHPYCARRAIRSPPGAECHCKQVSLETGQSNLDCSVLAALTPKKIILGVIDLSNNTVETPELVAARIRRALPYAEARNLLIAPDCGMKYLPRPVAFAKMKAGGKLDRARRTGERARGGAASVNR